MAFLHLNFESKYLNGNTDVNIILPDRPRDVETKVFYRRTTFKVLWLLHGTYGDYSDWIRRTNIELYACERDLIVVMPSALNSNYSNWKNSMMGYDMFHYLTEELMPLVYNWFPASNERKDNFIAGLSMGGGGALKYALHNPEKFSGAACLAFAPLNFSLLTEQDKQEERLRNKILNVGNFEKYLNSDDNLWKKISEFKEAKEMLPKLYIVCGTKDFGFDRHIQFKEYTKSLGIPICFEEIPNYKHEWRFWDKAVQKAISFFLGDSDQKKTGNEF